MIDKDKKIIIFKDDLTNDDVIGKVRYVKYLDDDKHKAVFYNPIIVPRDFKHYVDNGTILKAYEIDDYNVLMENEDKAYTFRATNDVYVVTKGIELDKKRILLVDKSMNLSLDLPKYSYDIIDAGFRIFPLNKNSDNKSYCYVASEEMITDDLKQIMLPVVESISGVLSVNTYPYEATYTYKKKRR